MNLTAPAGVRAELRRGLAWVEEGHAGDGLRPATVAWARRLAGGAEITRDKAVKMRAWLARHKVDSAGEGFSPGEKGYPSPGRVAWALWGGDPAVGWSERMVSHFEGNMSKIDKYMGNYYGDDAPELPYPLTPEGLTPAMKATMPAEMVSAFVAVYNVASSVGVEEEDAFGLAMGATSCLGWRRGADGSFSRMVEEGGAPEEPGEMEKAGRVLSAANEAKLRAAADAIMAVLGATAPKASESDMEKAAVIKIDEERRTATGWASVVVDALGAVVVDKQGDVIDVGDLRDAMHGYMAKSRAVKVNHGGPVVGTTVEMLVVDDAVAKMLGMTSKIRGAVYTRKYDTTPEGEAAWQEVKKRAAEGRSSMSSIGGSAVRVPA